jgi:hypothetical protein
MVTTTNKQNKKGIRQESKQSINSGLLPIAWIAKQHHVAFSHTLSLFKNDLMIETTILVLEQCDNAKKSA